MMAVPAPPPAAAGNALSAFLRGVERRALVVAELQSGDPAVADRAVAAAMHAFSSHAAGWAMADWADRFWALLCSTPRLRSADAGGDWPPALLHLSQMAAGDRLALLLRIGAGLDEASAAAVLGVDLAAYRQALAAACPLDSRGHPDPAAWRALAEQVQLQVRELAPARLLKLAPLREASLAVERPAPAQDPVPPVSTRQPSRPRATRLGRGRVYGVIGMAVLLVIAALWAWRASNGGSLVSAEAPVAREGVLAEAGPVQVEELPAADAAPVNGEVDLYAASDAAMLADPDLPLAREADFYAWFAAGGPMPVDESQPQPARPLPVTAALETVDGDQ
ncbi:MAG: hypothetical protein ACOH1V_14325 [Stenotrophomonas sp.]